MATTGFTATPGGGHWDAPGAFPTPVGDQCVTEACVGWAVGYHAMSWLLRRRSHDGDGDRGPLDLSLAGNQVSPSWVYNFLNQGDGSRGLGGIEHGARLLIVQGAASMRSMPATCDPTALPTVWAKREASRAKRSWRAWKLGLVPFRITEPAYRVDLAAATRFLLQTGPILIDFVAPPSFAAYAVADHDRNADALPLQGWVGDEAPRVPCYVPRSDEARGVAHVAVLVGYDARVQTPFGPGAYRLLNSSGSAWGHDGRAWIPEAVLNDWADSLVLNSAAALAWDPPAPDLEHLKVYKPTKVWRFQHARTAASRREPGGCPCPALMRDFSHCPQLTGLTDRLWHDRSADGAFLPLWVESPPFPPRRDGVRAEAVVLASAKAEALLAAANERSSRPGRWRFLQGLPVLEEGGPPFEISSGRFVQTFRVLPELAREGELLLDVRLVRGRTVLGKRIVRIAQLPGQHAQATSSIAPSDPLHSA